MAAIEPKVANLIVPPQPLHFLQPTQPLLLVGCPHWRILVYLQHLDAAGFEAFLDALAVRRLVA